MICIIFPSEIIRRSICMFPSHLLRYLYNLLLIYRVAIHIFPSEIVWKLLCCNSFPAYHIVFIWSYKCHLVTVWYLNNCEVVEPNVNTIWRLRAQYRLLVCLVQSNTIVLLLLDLSYVNKFLWTTTPGPIFMIEKYCSRIMICTTIPVVRLRDGT